MSHERIRFKLKTIKEIVTFDGLGLHSGIPVQLTIKPGQHGIVFNYQDKLIQAKAENVTQTTLHTCLGEVATIEHLMSSFASIGISDAEVELSSPELPALDGCSEIFCENLIKAGIQDIGEAYFIPFEGTIREENENHIISITMGNGKLHYVMDTGNRWPGKQEYHFQFDSEEYKKQIAPARTFGFEEQIPQIQAAGLAKGLDLSTALILNQNGYLNPAKFPDEPARHKMLDMIGDIYLAGIPLHFLDIEGYKSGHTGNTLAAKKLAKSVNIERSIISQI